jgi:uncharacterized protein (TIGR00156 family)
MKKLIAAASVFLLTACLAYGQYTGPNSTDKVLTVKEVLKNAPMLDRSDRLVKVKGNIVKQLKKNTFLFKDSTGSIQVEISKKSFPARLFDDKTVLYLIAEVDYDFLEGSELEVKQVFFL